MLKPKFDYELFDLLMQDFSDDEFSDELIERRKVRRVFVAS